MKKPLCYFTFVQKTSCICNSMQEAGAFVLVLVEMSFCCNFSPFPSRSFSFLRRCLAPYNFFSFLSIVCVHVKCTHSDLYINMLRHFPTNICGFFDFDISSEASKLWRLWRRQPHQRWLRRTGAACTNSIYTLGQIHFPPQPANPQIPTCEKSAKTFSSANIEYA